MPAALTRADALREYLTGATSEGSSQSDPSASFGNYRSSTEAVSMGITLINALANVSVLYASGGNPQGLGTLTAVDSHHLTWQPAGVAQAGSPCFFNGTGDTQIVEAYNSPGQYLRITASGTFTPGVMSVSLAYLYDDVFGFDDVSIAVAGTGESQYRATMLRNESSGQITGFQRWIGTLGDVAGSDLGQLGVSGSGTISTSDSFNSWPSSGWVQIQTAGDTLREIVYYTSRTATTLTVPSAGRGLLTTLPSAGSGTDLLYPVPGVAIGFDPAGAIAFGSPIQAIEIAGVIPSGVVWTVGITPSTGLQAAAIASGYQVGIWMWRQIPPGASATPNALTQYLDTFNSY